MNRFPIVLVAVLSLVAPSLGKDKPKAEDPNKGVILINGHPTLHVTDVQEKPSQGTVEGKCENISGHVLKFVDLTMAFYEKDHSRISTTEDTTSDLGVGEVWRFKFYEPDGARSYALVSSFVSPADPPDKPAGGDKPKDKAPDGDAGDGKTGGH